VAVGPLVMNTQTRIVLDNGYAGPNFILLDVVTYILPWNLLFKLFEILIKNMKYNAPSYCEYTVPSSPFCLCLYI
jgi:hypothetical protein